MAAGQRAVKFKAGLQHLGRASLSLVVGVFCFRQSGTFKMSSRETSRDKQADALIPAGARMTKQDDPCTLQHSVESRGENHSISATCSWLVKVTHVRLLGAESASPRTETALIPDCPVLKYPQFISLTVCWTLNIIKMKKVRKGEAELWPQVAANTRGDKDDH